MRTADIAAVLILAALAGSTCWQAFRLWHHPGNLGRMLLGGSVLPFGRDFRRGAARGSLPLGFGLGLAAAGVLIFTMSRPVPGQPTDGAIAAVACFGLMLAAFALHFTIIWFNRPLWLVPPHMRADHGTVSAWVIRRRQGGHA